MKIVFGIAGFVTGVMLGLLLGLVEMRLISGFEMGAATPFIVGVTVITTAITGIVTGLKMYKKY